MEKIRNSYINLAWKPLQTHLRVLRRSIRIHEDRNTLWGWEVNEIVSRLCIIKNMINEEIKSRLNSDNAHYHSVQNLSSSRLLSKNVKITIYKTTILPVVLYGCETCSLILKEELWLRICHNRVLRWIFGLQRYEMIWCWRKLHNGELHSLYSSPDIRVITVIKPRRLRRTRHIPRIGGQKCIQGFDEKARRKDTTRKI
jgi:hypothetical protein